MSEELNDLSEAEKGFSAPDTSRPDDSGVTTTEFGQKLESGHDLESGYEQKLMAAHTEWLQGVVEKSTGPAKVVAEKVAAQEPMSGKTTEFSDALTDKVLDFSISFGQALRDAISFTTRGAEYDINRIINKDL